MTKEEQFIHHLTLWMKDNKKWEIDSEYEKGKQEVITQVHLMMQYYKVWNPNND